jgi:hypothetical protein
MDDSFHDGFDRMYSRVMIGAAYAAALHGWTQSGLSLLIPCVMRVCDRLSHLYQDAGSRRNDLGLICFALSRNVRVGAPNMAILC